MTVTRAAVREASATRDRICRTMRDSDVGHATPVPHVNLQTAANRASRRRQTVSAGHNAGHRPSSVMSAIGGPQRARHTRAKLTSQSTTSVGPQTEFNFVIDAFARYDVHVRLDNQGQTNLCRFANLRALAVLRAQPFASVRSDPPESIGRRLSALHVAMARDSRP